MSCTPFRCGPRPGVDCKITCDCSDDQPRPNTAEEAAEIAVAALNGESLEYRSLRAYQYGWSPKSHSVGLHFHAHQYRRVKEKSMEASSPTNRQYQPTVNTLQEILVIVQALLAGKKVRRLPLFCLGEPTWSTPYHAKAPNFETGRYEVVEDPIEYWDIVCGKSVVARRSSLEDATAYAYGKPDLRVVHMREVVDE